MVNRKCHYLLERIIVRNRKKLVLPGYAAKLYRILMTLYHSKVYVCDSNAACRTENVGQMGIQWTPITHIYATFAPTPHLIL